jgi:hypothetical protein
VHATGLLSLSGERVLGAYQDAPWRRSARADRIGHNGFLERVVERDALRDDVQLQR